VGIFDMQLETRYARSGDISIAYQVVGDGALDLVFVMGWVSHLDYFWAEPSFARFLRRLASFSRLILFDKRGTGLSDRVPAVPTLEERMDDVRAVMDAAGSPRAALLGVSEGGAMCALFAATYPERTSSLIMVGAFPRRNWAADFPWGRTPEEHETYLAAIEKGWGTPFALAARAPSRARDEEFRRWWATYLRMSASPGAAQAVSRMNAEIDIRQVLPSIRVPTLILHRTGDLTINIEIGRYMAGRIPNAKFVELPGADHLPFVGDQDALLDEVEQFLTGARAAPEPERVLATVLLTEIVQVAEVAARLGDRRWRDLRRAHDEAIRQELARFRGRAIGATRDGFQAIFDGPARAIRCAAAIGEAVRPLGLQIRAGLHTGECDLADGELGGIAVHIAARVLAHARAGEIAVSSTVKDLVAGSGIRFGGYDPHFVKGIPGELGLFRVEPEAEPRQASAAVAVPAGVNAGKATAPLSRREREIAALIALGLSNRQVAEELVITLATAERHVANILRKLGFRSRAQIAAWAVARDLLRTGPD
jgi:pimeloyl-ACP methyl ester carboxylesterase/class 3 adenylate cyclase/DNA-binding CsgD family transcriptional regulator